MKIPQDRFLEMNEDVDVKVLYPNIQVDVFKYKSPHRLDSGDTYDSIGYLVSTIFSGNLYYEYHRGDELSDEYADKIIEDLKDNVRYSVIKTL